MAEDHEPANMPRSSELRRSHEQTRRSAACDHHCRSGLQCFQNRGSKCGGAPTELRKRQRQGQGSTGHVVEEAESHGCRAGPRIDQNEGCLPAVAAGYDMRDAPATGANISQSRDCGKRAIGWAEAESQNADLAATRSIAF